METRKEIQERIKVLEYYLREVELHPRIRVQVENELKNLLTFL